MQLTGLTESLRESKIYHDLLTRLQDTSTSLHVIRSARPLLLAALAHDWHAPVIYLTAKIKRAYNVTEQLPVWTGQQIPVYRFGEPTAQFYEHAPWAETTIRSRIETLAALMPPGDTTSDNHPVIVSAAHAWMQRTLPVHHFRKASMTLKVKQTYAIDRLLTQWLSIGYEAVSIVVEPGTFSRRGGLVDIFPAAAIKPVRIEFFGDEIDSLRYFDPSTQRSEARIEQ
ncbi:MAG TPA: hypothetical protein VHL11_08460, partial [Phototrophicaceae bacterium]|nr:hypothetical protein [Phototrophicaceae bacterium]